jgi:hypothetical protein
MFFYRLISDFYEQTYFCGGAGNKGKPLKVTFQCGEETNEMLCRNSFISSRSGLQNRYYRCGDPLR